LATDRLTDKQTDKWRGALHQAALAVASGGLTKQKKTNKKLQIDIGQLYQAVFYNRCLYQIWYRAQVPHITCRNVPNSHNMKIQDGGGRHRAICTKFGGQIHHGHAGMITRPKVETGT